MVILDKKNMLTLECFWLVIQIEKIKSRIKANAEHFALVEESLRERTRADKELEYHYAKHEEFLCKAKKLLRKEKELRKRKRSTKARSFAFSPFFGLV